MTGLHFDFGENDIVLSSGGTFRTSDINSQCAALIAVSSICRITQPQIGAQLPSLLVNRKRNSTFSAIKAAERAVQRDGGKNVKIQLDNNNQLQFYAEYDS